MRKLPKKGGPPHKRRTKPAARALRQKLKRQWAPTPVLDEFGSLFAASNVLATYSGQQLEGLALRWGLLRAAHFVKDSTGLATLRPETDTEFRQRIYKEISYVWRARRKQRQNFLKNA